MTSEICEAIDPLKEVFRYKSVALIIANLDTVKWDKGLRLPFVIFEHHNLIAQFGLGVLVALVSLFLEHFNIFSLCNSSLVTILLVVQDLNRQTIFRRQLFSHVLSFLVFGFKQFVDLVELFQFMVGTECASCCRRVLPLNVTREIL